MSASQRNSIKTLLPEIQTDMRFALEHIGLAGKTGLGKRIGTCGRVYDLFLVAVLHRCVDMTMYAVTSTKCNVVKTP